MTVLKRKRKAQSHTATGKTLALTQAANTDYPPWPKDLVDMPTHRGSRARCVVWFELLQRHRTPLGWQPSDAARIALLARTLVAWEREAWLLAEQADGDAGLADRWRAVITVLSRQLGLSRAIREPQIEANDALVRDEIKRHLDEVDDDDLLARPKTVN
jgi:hypothetical protein